MSAPVTPLDPASPQGVEVANRLTRTLGAIEYEISQRADLDEWGTHPPKPRPPQPPTPPPREQEQQAA